VLHLVISSTRNNDRARIGDSFEARGNVHTFAVEITTLDHNVAKIHANAKNDVAIFGLIAVGGRHALLQIDGTLNGIDGAGELDQYTVAGDLEDATAMLGDQRLQNITAPGLQDRQCAGFVSLHQPAIAHYIGSKDGSDAAFHRRMLWQLRRFHGKV